MTKQTAEKTDAIARLRKDYGVRAGSTIYTTTLHTSRSGMSRVIAVYVSHKGEIHNISALVAKATDSTLDPNRWGVKVQGCGMDMGFALVYGLSRAMFPKGHKCTGSNGGPRYCPSNDHSNDYGQAARMARDELATEGVDVYDRGARAVVSKRADEIREREGLTYRKGRVHRDGGYALRQRWL